MNTLRQPLLRELTTALLVALLLLQSATAVAPGPAWWSTQNVTDPSAVADDFAVANIGQLKHMAAKAAAAMDAELPGGAGAVIHALVDAWGDTLEAASKPGNGLAINQGQLKHVATPFYDRLGLPYPWAGSSALRDDYLLVNLGQLKHVFSFPLKFRTLGQGAVTIPQATLQAALDAWNALGDEDDKPVGSGEDDFDGDGIPNLQEYLMGHALFDPLDIDGDRIADAVEDAHPGILSKLNFADAVWDKEAGGAAAYYDLDWNVSYQGDGVMNYEEVLRLGLDPAASTTSTRTDGLTDAEVLVWTLNAGAPLALNADPLRTFWEGIDADWMDATANGSYLGWLDAGDANNDGEPDGLAEFRADMLDPWPVWEPWNPSVWAVQAPSPGSFFDPVTLSSVLMDWDEDGMADTDRDDDGLPDLWEYRYEFDLRDGEDRNHDADNDGLTNLEEYQLGTNPRLADTDGDGFDDHSEFTGGGDPLVATIVPALSLSLAGSSHPYVFPGQTTPALAVKVTQGDLPVAGVTVVFDLGAAAGRLLPAMHLSASPGMQMSVTTGADGVAAVTYAAGSEPGSASITATAPGITGAVEFGVTVVPVPQPFGAGGSGGGGTYGGPATVQPSKPPRSGAATAQETAAATSDGFRIRVKRRDGADDDPVDAKPYSDLVPEYLQPSGLNLAALVGYQISFDVHSWQFHTRLDFEPLPMSGPYQKPPVPGGSRQYLVVVYNAVDVESDARVPKHVGGLSFQYTSSGGRQILLTGNIPDTFIKVESSGNNPSVKFEPPPASKPEERVWIRLLPVDLKLRATGKIEPAPENDSYQKCATAGQGDDLGPLPMGTGRQDYPGGAYTAPLQVIGTVPIAQNVNWRWDRVVTYRSWYLYKNQQNNGWIVSVRRPKIGPKNDHSSTDFEDSTPSAGGKIYIYDNSALGIAAGPDTASPIGIFIFEKKQFTYKLETDAGGAWKEAGTLDVGQKIILEKVQRTGVVATDFKGVENSCAVRVLDMTITEAEARAIVGGTLPITINNDAQ